MSYLFHILTMINIYILLSLSLNILVGYIGRLSIAHAAFYGIGAYASALLTTKLGLNFFITLPIAIAIATLLSFVVSIPSLRLKGDYSILATFAFQLIVFDILYNIIPLTGGPFGIKDIPSPRLFSLIINTPLEYFIFSLIIVGIAVFFIIILLSAPFGRVLKAIREDEISAQALGKSVDWFKIKAFAIASALAAVSGILFAHYVTYIDPTSFTVEESIFILSIVLVGGAGNIKGPVIGALVLLTIPEILKFTGIPDTIAPNIRQMIYGAMLVLFMYFRPRGIAGEYKFE